MQPIPTDFDPPTEPALKTSVVGWVSLALMIAGLIVGGLPFAGLVILGAVEEMQGTSRPDDDPLIMLGGCGILIGAFLFFGAITTGIIGLAMPGRKVAPLIGLVVSGVFAIMAFGLILIGLAAG